MHGLYGKCNIVSHGQAGLICKLEKGQSYAISPGCETVNAETCKGPDTHVTHRH
jgi:hypothetical protein